MYMGIPAWNLILNGGSSRTQNIISVNRFTLRKEKNELRKTQYKGDY